MNIVFNILKVVFLLGFLIFIHEGGHFIVAKFFKVKVEAFSIGFGHKIFKKQKGETVYSIGIIPLGGYVQMTGETEKSNDERSFNNAKMSHRIAIVAAGAIVNIIFAVVIFFVLSISSKEKVTTIVSEIIPEATGVSDVIQIGDKILQVENKKTRLRADIANALENYESGEVQVLVERNNEELSLKVVPIKYEGIYILGVKVLEKECSITERMYYSFWETIDFSKSFINSLKMLFTGKIGIDQMTGPIGISEVVVKTNGVQNFIYLLCLVSMSLGVTNLLPIPALDGGKIIILLVELFRGKALDEELELKIQSFGFLILMILSLYISYKDVLRIF